MSETASSTSSTGSKDSRETLGFQTEVRQLLKLMIHSLYSNKEIFLRELISNASDASDKLRFEALASPDLLADDTELGIVIEIDKSGRTLAVTDNGIGIPDGQRENVFGLFKRLHTKSAYEGTGLGLTICRRVMSNHNGTVELSSVRSGGTAALLRFWG